MKVHSVFQSKAFSHAAAAFSSVTSSYLRPTNIIPVGNLMLALSVAGTNPHGSDKAGCPVPVMVSVPTASLEENKAPAAKLTIKGTSVVSDDWDEVVTLERPQSALFTQIYRRDCHGRHH